MTQLPLPPGHRRIDPDEVVVGDLIQWTRGRVWREVIETDPYCERLVAKNGPWRKFKDGTISGSSRSDAWHNVMAACRRKPAQREWPIVNRQEHSGDDVSYGPRR